MQIEQIKKKINLLGITMMIHYYVCEKYNKMMDNTQNKVNLKNLKIINDFMKEYENNLEELVLENKEEETNELLSSDDYSFYIKFNIMVIMQDLGVTRRTIEMSLQKLIEEKMILNAKEKGLELSPTKYGLQIYEKIKEMIVLIDENTREEQ